MPGATIAQKVLARAAGLSHVEVGQIVDAQVDRVMSHENGALVAQKFRELGAGHVWDVTKMVQLFDHRVPADTEQTAAGHKAVRQFVKEQGLVHFYGERGGICHQVMPEKGHVRPGELIVGTDSHTTTYGAFGAVSAGIGATEMAGVWATGGLWLMVPPTIRISVEGTFQPHVYAKDLILSIIGRLGLDGADYRSVEFDGPLISSLSVASRMTICNQAMEMGAKFGIIPADDTTLSWLRPRTDAALQPVHSDADATFERHLRIDVSDLSPQVAKPHSPANVAPLEQVLGVHVDQAFLGSCTNARLEDLQIAAALLKGRKVAAGTRLIVTPASWEVYRDAAAAGYLGIFTDSGAVITNPGCGACIGGVSGILSAGEVCISSSNRNFRGRMGSADAQVYLSSPAVVAASAIAGVVADPREVAP